MKILFAANQVDKIHFFGKPIGKIIPPHELKKGDKNLDGFDWRIEKRPTKNQLLLPPNDSDDLKVISEQASPEIATEKEMLKSTLQEKMKNTPNNPPQKRLQN